MTEAEQRMLDESLYMLREDKNFLDCLDNHYRECELRPEQLDELREIATKMTGEP